MAETLKLPTLLLLAVRVVSALLMPLVGDVLELPVRAAWRKGMPQLASAALVLATSLALVVQATIAVQMLQALLDSVAELLGLVVVAHLPLKLVLRLSVVLELEPA
jgi:hypothetical protein